MSENARSNIMDKTPLTQSELRFLNPRHYFTVEELNRVRHDPLALLNLLRSTGYECNVHGDMNDPDVILSVSVKDPEGKVWLCMGQLEVALLRAHHLIKHLKPDAQR